MWLRLNSGGFSFAETDTIVSPDAAPNAVGVADIDADGTLDVAIGGFPGNIAWFAGNGDGTLGDAQVFPLLRGQCGANRPCPVPTAMVLADFNEDGGIDIATASLDSEDATVLANDGGGNFEHPIRLRPRASPVAILAADFDADGFLDLAVVGDSQDGAVVSTFPNRARPMR
jgi:hypothetical protein